MILTSIIIGGSILLGAAVALALVWAFTVPEVEYKYVKCMTCHDTGDANYQSDHLPFEECPDCKPPEPEPPPKQKTVPLRTVDLPFVQEGYKRLDAIGASFSDLEKFRIGLLDQSGICYFMENITRIIQTPTEVEFSFDVEIVKALQIRKIYLIYPDGDAYLPPRNVNVTLCCGDTFKAAYKVKGSFSDG